MKPRRKSVEPGAVFAESAWRSKEKNFLKDLFQGFRGNVLASLVASAITAAAGYFWGALSGISYVDIPVDSRKAAAPGIFWNYKIAFAEVVTLDNKYYQDAGFSPVAEELQSAFGSRRPNLNIVARR